MDIRIFLAALIAVFLIAYPGAALATQGHGAPEGIYAHQFAHIFFLASMVVLIYWLRQRKLVEEKGWKFIQHAAFFFIFWNLDVLTVHFLDEQAMLVSVEKVDEFRIRISSPLGRGVEIFYYAAKMDHLLCAPALLFLYLGLRRLLTETSFSAGKEML